MFLHLVQTSFLADFCVTLKYCNTERQRVCVLMTVELPDLHILLPASKLNARGAQHEGKVFLCGVETWEKMKCSDEDCSQLNFSTCFTEDTIMFDKTVAFTKGNIKL